jgi:trimeric autotransporter adhesin
VPTHISALLLGDTMNNSIRAIIDRALDDTEYPADAYNTAEHVDTQFDDDIEKLASALDFLGGNLNNIGTPEEKLLELYEFNKLANEGTAVVEGATGGAAAGGATAGAGGAAAAGTDAAADAAAAGPKNPYRNALGSRGRHAAFAQGAEAGITHGMERGRLSADALQGVKNTWNSGAGGKAALIGTGLGVLGAGALLGGAMSKSSHFTGDLMYDDDESFLGAGFNPYAYEAYEMEKAASYGISYEEYEMLKEAGMWDEFKAGLQGKAGNQFTRYTDAQVATASEAAAAVNDRAARYRALGDQLKDLKRQSGSLNMRNAGPARAAIREEMRTIAQEMRNIRTAANSAVQFASPTVYAPNSRAANIGANLRNFGQRVAVTGSNIGRGVAATSGAAGRGVVSAGRGVGSGIASAGRGVVYGVRSAGEAISGTAGRTLERVSPVKPGMFNVGNVDVSPPSPTATRAAVKEVAESGAAAAASPTATRGVVKEVAESGAAAAASPTATRGVVKEVAESGAGAASKPGFLSRHGGKLGIGAGVIGLGGLGYAAMRNRRRD